MREKREKEALILGKKKVDGMCDGEGFISKRAGGLAPFLQDDGGKRKCTAQRERGRRWVRERGNHFASLGGGTRKSLQL